jgi:hypothetical protein
MSRSKCSGICVHLLVVLCVIASSALNERIMGGRDCLIYYIIAETDEKVPMKFGIPSDLMLVRIGLRPARI